MKARISLILMAFVIPISVMCKAAEKYPRIFQANQSQSQDAQQTDEFLKRLKDEKFRDLQAGTLWTLVHDYKDAKHMQGVLDTTYSYINALAKYEQGDSSSLQQLGGIKQFKDQLAQWLNDEDQAVRAFAATILGISGDRTYAQHIAKLLVKKEMNPDDVIYDRGRAALALGMLQAKEYGKDLVQLLSSTNEYDRVGAIIGLGWMADKEHIQAVTQLLKDSNEKIREAAKQALEMMKAGELIKQKQ